MLQVILTYRDDLVAPHDMERYRSRSRAGDGNAHAPDAAMMQKYFI
jgi:hypothetical protein